MIKTLRPMGNNFGIIIDRPTMDLMGIEPGAELELTPQTRPFASAGRQGSQGSRASFGEEDGVLHRAALKELAD